jgi:protein phosphatase 2C family protein 2/3
VKLTFSPYSLAVGSAVAKFSGQTLHDRLAASEEYKKGDYAAALKRAFLGTDEDLRASEFDPVRPFCNLPSV